VLYNKDASTADLTISTSASPVVLTTVQPFCSISVLIKLVAGQFAERHFAERHFAERHFAERTFCRRTFCRTDVLPNGHFTERTFYRTDSLPNGQFAENRDIF
jgi:hypothetical protein